MNAALRFVYGCMAILFICLTCMLFWKEYESAQNTIFIEAYGGVEDSEGPIFSTLRIKGDCAPEIVAKALCAEGMDATEKSVLIGSFYASQYVDQVHIKYAVPPFRIMRITGSGHVRIERHPDSSLNDNQLKRIGDAIHKAAHSKEKLD